MLTRRSLIAAIPLAARAAGLNASIQQITRGPHHHFFGYIGHVRTIPWNRSGRYILSLRTTFQDRMPNPGESADIVLLDTARDYAITPIEQTRAWNPQQGTMFYWNPAKPETQFFFNDRDPQTHSVFTVLYDIAQKRRIIEYRHNARPVANSGVAQNGGSFLAINYGRLADLRPVTGYPGAFNWSAGVDHPDNDGIFRIDAPTRRVKLLVSYRQLAATIGPRATGAPLFINHTLWNRDATRIFFYARAHFGQRDRQIDVPFTVKPDGTGLTPHTIPLGGHPEWETGNRLIGANEGNQVIYDTDRRELARTLGDRTIFPSPGGDIALSPDSRLFVNGYRDNGHNVYSILRRADNAHVRTEGLDVRPWLSGDLRCDPSPAWNRTGTEILVPAIAADETRTRQLFLIRLT